MRVVLFRSIELNGRKRPVGTVLDVTYDFAHELVNAKKAKFYEEVKGKTINGKQNINLNQE